MKTRIASARMAALAVTLLLSGGSALSAGPNSVPGERLDSGLGELPPYVRWVDPTGKSPMGKPDDRLLSGMVLSGSSELSRVDWTVSASGARAVADMNFAQLHGLVRRGISELARAEWTSELARPSVASATRGHADTELAQLGR